MSQENVESIRRGWEAWLRGDIDALVSLWDPDVIWDTSHFREWPESSYYGVEGVRKFLTEWLEVWGEYKIDVEEVRSAPDGRVVSLFTHHGRGQQNDRELYNHPIRLGASGNAMHCGGLFGLRQGVRTAPQSACDGLRRVSQAPAPEVGHLRRPHRVPGPSLRGEG